jgi:hypothetical protein
LCQVEHKEGTQPGSKKGRKPQLPDPGEAQAKADAEHEENQSDLGERLDPSDIEDEGKRRSVWPDDHAGEKITNDHRKTDALT